MSAPEIQSGRRLPQPPGQFLDRLLSDTYATTVVTSASPGRPNAPGYGQIGMAPDRCLCHFTIN